MRIPQITPQHFHPKHLNKVPHKKSLFVAANAAVLVILAGSTTAYASLSKNVTVSLDGHTQTIRTMSGTVASALASEGITLSPADKIKVDGKAVAKTTAVDDGDKVTVAFAKPVVVAVDGKTEKTATVHDHTVGDVLDRFGVKPSAQAFVSGDRTDRLSRGGTRIVVSNPKELTIEADGKSKTLTSTAPTVGAALKEAGVALDANDEVEPAVGELLSDGDAVKVTRIELDNKTEVVEVEQPVQYKDDKTMEKGTTKVLDPGQAGRAREHVLVTEADGKERSRLVLESAQLSEPEMKVVARGTAPAPAEPVGVWDKIAACESGGNWQINTGNGYYGGLQFSAATWKSVGGPGLPHEHSREVQIKYAKILQARSGWGQWGCAHARND
ncbi:MAG TPA: ubiquitin-like domain-containing protein [Aeromicrobium sp.]|nr:ubiquitin-like domain-containing protein [Aeromicrobium sp.]HKY58727.1 ubiquitin-like domain-containing protein [Aeromicrobium sp.]